MLKSLLLPTLDSRVQRLPTLYWVQEHITQLRKTAGTKTLMHTWTDEWMDGREDGCFDKGNFFQVMLYLISSSIHQMRYFIILEMGERQLRKLSDNYKICHVIFKWSTKVQTLKISINNKIVPGFNNTIPKGRKFKLLNSLNYVLKKTCYFWNFYPKEAIFF